MSVKLYLKRARDGKIIEYGSRAYDSLVLQPDGSLHFESLQDGESTKDGYTFCLPDGSDPREQTPTRARGVKPYLDIGGERAREKKKRWYVCRDETIIASLPSREEAVTLVRELRRDEDTEQLQAEYFLIEGERPDNCREEEEREREEQEDARRPLPRRAGGFH